jgi:hypothetical protein
VSIEATAAIIGGLVGAAAATIGTLLLEFVIRPGVTRRRVAAVLRIEIAANRQTLIGLDELWKFAPDAIPPDLYFDTTAFENLSDSLGTLRTNELEPVLQLYLQLRYLLRLVSQFHGEWEITRSPNAAPERKRDAESRMHNIRTAFKDSAVTALELANSSWVLLNRIPRDRLGSPGMVLRRLERNRVQDLHRRQKP